MRVRDALGRRHRLPPSPRQEWGRLPVERGWLVKGPVHGRQAAGPIPLRFGHDRYFAAAGEGEMRNTSMYW
jgi:hypothetical protein